MKIIEKKLEELKPYDNNPRLNDRAVPAVAESLKKFGWQQPIVIDRNGVIVCGHTRYKAALTLGMKTAPCKYADELTEEEITAYRLADNKTAELAEWDADKMEEELAKCSEFDMSAFGFDLANFDEAEQVIDDDYDKNIEDIEPQTKPGDKWMLGEHVLFCGDATKAEDVNALLGGVRADISFTSPPYNAGFGKNITKDNGRSKYLNDDDNKTQEEYRQFIDAYIDNVSVNADYNFVNIEMLANNKRALIDILHDNRDRLADVIIWDKERSQPELDENVLNSEWEFIFVFSNQGTRRIGTNKFHGTLRNIIHIPNACGNEFAEVHNATFPMEFASYFVENFSSDTVVDLFGGTGTTMIACEQLGRRCYMMEIDPHYCDVIIDRWEKFTGSKAKLIDD